MITSTPTFTPSLRQGERASDDRAARTGSEPPTVHTAPSANPADETLFLNDGSDV